MCSRLSLKCDGTRAETRFRLSAKRTSSFKSVGESVQSTTGSRGVRISGSNARYTTFRGSMKRTGYPLHSPVSHSLPLPAPPCATTFQLDSTNSLRVFKSLSSAPRISHGVPVFVGCLCAKLPSSVRREEKRCIPPRVLKTWSELELGF